MNNVLLKDKKMVQANLHILADSLNNIAFQKGYKITVGFDGFVDEIIAVVDKRQSFDNYQRIETIEQFGDRISRSANLSTNIELVPEIVKLGGNGPIMANALCRMGQHISYIGALGWPDIHPVFQDLAANCQQVISFAEPAHTDALEFNDGKIMLGKLASLNSITWENLCQSAGLDTVRSLFTEADLVAAVNWTMIPYMNQLWHNLLEFAAEQQFSTRPIFFVDLADPEKRSQKDIQLALEYIQGFSRYYNVVLGLNRKEASEIARVIGLRLSREPDRVTIAEITQALADQLDLWCLVVHSVKDAAAVGAGEYSYIQGPYCEKPKLTTGAGDNFNAGFCLGLLLELPLTSVLSLAKAASGFYVRNGFSPNLIQLQEFTDLWLNKIDISF